MVPRLALSGCAIPTYKPERKVDRTCVPPPPIRSAGALALFVSHTGATVLDEPLAVCANAICLSLRGNSFPFGNTSITKSPVFSIDTLRRIRCNFLQSALDQPRFKVLVQGVWLGKWLSTVRCLPAVDIVVVSLHAYDRWVRFWHAAFRLLVQTIAHAIRRVEFTPQRFAFEPHLADCSWLGIALDRKGHSRNRRSNYGR